MEFPKFCQDPLQPAPQPPERGEDGEDQVVAARMLAEDQIRFAKSIDVRLQLCGQGLRRPWLLAHRDVAQLELSLLEFEIRLGAEDFVTVRVPRPHDAPPDPEDVLDIESDDDEIVVDTAKL